DAYRLLGGHLQVEQLGKRAPEAARIEHEARVDRERLRVRGLHRQTCAAVDGLEAEDPVPIPNLHTLLRCLVGEQLVEGSPIHLISVAVAARELIGEVDIGVLGAAYECGAILELVAGTLDRFEHTRLFDEIEAMREQALADDEARKLLRLEHE